MAIIKYSSDFLRGTTQSLQGRIINLQDRAYVPPGAIQPEFGLLSNGSRNYLYGYKTEGNQGIIRVMSGTIPGSAELATIAPPAGTAILWQVPVDYYTDPTGSKWYSDPTSISTYFATTIATGVATWFWICTTTTNYEGYPNYSSALNVIGDIGTVGSGSDMEMVNPSIVAGQFLRIININLKMPASLFG